MDQASVTVDDPYNLSRDTLINEYLKLSECYNELKQSEHQQLQEIHGLKRELQTALNGRNFLSGELDIINSEHLKEIDEIKDKHRSELEECKKQLLSYKNMNELLETETNKLETNQDLPNQYINIKSNISLLDNNQSINDEKIIQLEEQNDELAEVVKNLQVELTEALKKNFQFEMQIEDLKDRLMCAEENLKAKRNELEEKNELCDTVHERLIQLNGELNALRSESDTANKRGNSLFAEVDDQRQKLKVILESQKASYIQMKNELEESRQEVRKLKRENTAMYKEIEVCTHVFMNAEQHHTEKLNERIGELIKDNEAINKKLDFTERCLSDLTHKNDVKWLDPMLTLCKSETDDLKDKLYRCSMQKVSIANTLRNSQEETARWRFEALKSRCIISERESLLEECNIKFDVVSGIDKKIRKIDNENVAPNIGLGSQPLLSYKRKSFTKSQSPLKKVIETSQKEVTVDDGICASNKNQGFEVLKKITNDVGTENKVKQQIRSETGLHPIESNKTNLATRVPIKKTDHAKLQVVLQPVNGDVCFSSPVQSNSSTKMTFNRTKNPVVKFNNTTTSPLPSPAVCLSSFGPTKSKITTTIKTSGGILKQNAQSISNDRKVKFTDGGSEDVEKTSSLRTVEKFDREPKSAIKKRIFVPSRKPLN